MTAPDELAAAVLARTSTPGTDVLVGKVTATNPATRTATVSITGGTLSVALIADDYIPLVGDTAVVLRQGGRVVLLTSVSGTPRPAEGTVKAPVAVGTAITVTTVAGDFQLGFVASYAPVAGDAVSIMWGTAGKGVVVGKLGVIAPAPVPPPPPPPPPPAPTTGEDVFSAVDAATWRGEWRDDTGDVIQGVAPGYPGTNNGAWFYGPSLAATLAGATVTGADIYLDRTQGGTYAAQTIAVQHHNAQTRPGGNVAYNGAVSNAAVAVGQAGWFPLDAGVAQLLVAGGGLGIAGASYARLTDLGAAPQNGAVRIRWTR